MASRIFKLSLFILSVFFLEQSGYATTLDRDTLPSRFKINEEWYLQLQGGINYSIAKNTRYVSPLKVVSPQLTFSYGKRFTPVWGGRLLVMWGKDKGAFYLHDKNSPLYSFAHTGVFGIGSFNFVEFFSNKRNSCYTANAWNVSALLGLGAIYTSFGFTEDITGQRILDRNNDTYLSLFAGLEISRWVSDNWEINLELSSAWMSKKYNGFLAPEANLKMNGHLNLLIGVRYTFNRAKRRSQLKKIDYVEKEQFLFSPPLPADTTQSMEKKPDVVREAVRRQAEVKETAYSIEELLETIDNHESIKGKNLAKTRIRFDYGSCNIKPFVAIHLDKVVELMKRSHITLLIKGYIIEKPLSSTDHLSEKRIKMVRDYLVTRGINRDRLVYQVIGIPETPLDEGGIEQIIEIESLSLY